MAYPGMTRLAIIADDLSSATDCGAQVVRSGLSVVVPLGGYSPPAQARPTQVISVDTDSRSLSADRAYAKVRTAARQLVAEGWTDFYKSVDSTLRGNLGAEIEAVLEIVKPDCAVIAPAFPKYGRTTVNGVQYLHGRPLHETEFGSDPTAVVDARGKVHGVDNLYVADASIMPVVPRANTNIPALIVGERISAWLTQA